MLAVFVDLAFIFVSHFSTCCAFWILFKNADHYQQYEGKMSAGLQAGNACWTKTQLVIKAAGGKPSSV